MSIIEAVKQAEASADKMRQDAQLQADKELSKARADALLEITKLQEEFEQEKNSLHKASEAKIAADKTLKAKKNVDANKEISLQAKAKFPQAIKQIIDRVTSL